MVIFGASGDLTKRLLMPAIYNLACDGLLPERFAIIGSAMEDLSSEQFRDRMSATIREFSTRAQFDHSVWDDLVRRVYYTPGKFDDTAAFRKLGELIGQIDTEHETGGNLLFYFATPPWAFGLISGKLHEAKLIEPGKGWRRVIVEKPFGHDLPSAVTLNRELLAYWSESQIYRIDHYLGKETVQNILAFRFSNEIFEPLLNKNHVDHIQLTVAESVGVEGRGGYYESSGVLRDMIQNHMFQMMAYVCMEPPTSFGADAVRNEKVKLLDAVRTMTKDEVATHAVRGQYGPGQKPDGSPMPGYRQEEGVAAESRTETFAALKLHVDNWRWEGVPVYLRSGKRLWKRDTEIAIQFKRAPDVLFRNTPAGPLEGNRLVFHIQPDQGIELRFQAKSPGPSMLLQKVNMRFNYGEAFKASRGTGYEVLVYNCMIGDATLFSRTDLVESAWRIAQPALEAWGNTPAAEFPNYPAGSWGPKAAFDLIEHDGRRWIESINRDVLERVPLFQGCDPVFLYSLAMMLKPVVCAPGETIIRKGDFGQEMYFICRGEVEVLSGEGQLLSRLKEGNFFGEIGLLLSQPRTAHVRAATPCDLFVLEKGDFLQVLKDQPQFAQSISEIARTRYKLAVQADQMMAAAGTE
jgi:glucose-6-phosphate 1-dehydrogenase